MSHVEELLAAAKRYCQAVAARYRAEVLSTRYEDAYRNALDAEEDATANLLEIAGRVG